MEKEENVT